MVLCELHEGHLGMTRMKCSSGGLGWRRILRIQFNIVLGVRSPPSAPLQPWSLQSRPLARIHIDYARSDSLVITDTHLKWVEVFPTSSATSSVTIALLQSMFALFELPETIVSDNSQCFVSEEFKSSLSRN